jgi:hypothetical protein
MNDNYQRILVAGEQEDNATILATLREILAGRLTDDLKLVNYFRQVPVSYGASVLTVEEESAELSVHQLQAVVIAQEKVTILKSRHFPRDVIANVNYVNVEKSRVVLSNFRYGLVRADRRMSVRVELGESVFASFSNDGVVVSGRLFDMSLTGISITVPEDPKLPLSEKGELRVSFPNDIIQVPASLLTVKQIGPGYRLIFEIEATRATELSISQYIFRRQVEIIKELKDHPGLNQ